MAALIGKQTSSAFVRARDIRHELRGESVSPAMLSILEALAEQQHALNKGVAEVVRLMDQMAEITKNYVGVAEQMKLVIEGVTNPAAEDLGRTHG